MTGTRNKNIPVFRQNLVTFVGHGPDNFSSLPGGPPTWLNGQAPVSGLVADAEGNLYGTTFEGGTDESQGGTVYEIMAGTHSVVTLYSFSSSGPNEMNGFYPNSLLNYHHFSWPA